MKVHIVNHETRRAACGYGASLDSPPFYYWTEEARLTTCRLCQETETWARALLLPHLNRSRGVHRRRSYTDVFARQLSLLD